MKELKKWSESITIEFVKIYLKHECLWNPSHSGYKIRYQRDKAYSDISAEFKATTMKALSIPEVKVKIKALRTTYSQQVHKILINSRPDSIYEPSLVWFHEMDRCLKHIPNRHNNLNIVLQDAPEVDSSSQIWVEQEVQNMDADGTNPDPLIPHTDEDYDSNQCEERLSNVKRERQSSPVYYKKLKKKNIKRFSSNNNSFESVPPHEREDEFDIYGKYIASQLRKMELQKALRLQLRIQNMVSEARISDIVSSD